MRSAPIERGDIELMLELAATGSLLKTARSLAVHHATAFRRLAELERKAGQPLFDRLPRGYVPTAAGQRLLAAAQRLRSELREFDARVLQLDRAADAPLKVTTSDGLAAAFFPPILRAFGDAHPAITIDLIVENRVMSLTEREVDVALRPAREVRGDIVCRRVGAVGYSLYASAEYVKRHGTIDADPPDFSHHAICAYGEPVGYFTTARWLNRYAQAARIVARCNSLTSMQAMARTGMCIVALPCVQGDADPQLVALAPPIKAMETSLWVCTHKRLRKTARVRTFLDFFYEAVGTERSRLAGIQLLKPRS
jgi:DNA-binding transcriptional LysR family regulator